MDKVNVSKKREQLHMTIWVHRKEQLREIVARYQGNGDLDATMTNVVERLIAKEAKRLKL